MTKKTTTTIIALSLTALASPIAAFAHCPLCTAGTGILAVAASSIGMSAAGVGLFAGAFSWALGSWVAKALKKKYLPYQDAMLTIVIFLSTALPVMPFLREYRGLYLSFWGEYGTLLHNTYLINLYVLGVFAGAAIMLLSLPVSKVLTLARKGRIFPFQGLTITFCLLIAAALALQLLF